MTFLIYYLRVLILLGILMTLLLLLLQILYDKLLYPKILLMGKLTVPHGMASNYNPILWDHKSVSVQTGLQITVGHCSMSDQICQICWMSERNQIFIPHYVRPNKIYIYICIVWWKNFALLCWKRNSSFWQRKSDFLLWFNRLDWACLNFNYWLSRSY